MWVHLLVIAVAIAIVAEPLELRVTAAGWALPLAGSLVILAMNPAALKLLLPWLPWMIYCALSVAISGVENAAHRYVIMIAPMLVGAASSAFVLDARLFETIRWDLAVLGVALLGSALLVFRKAGADDVLLLAPHSILAVLIFWFFLVDFLRSPNILAAVVCGAVFIVPVLATARTALGVVAILCVLGVSGLHLGKRIFFGALVGAGAVAALFTRAFAEKMLIDSTAGLSLENLRTSGRSVAWAALVERIPDRLLLGHGANASEPVLLAISEHFKHPHNDWLRIVFEYGLVGLLLFLAAAGWTVWRLWSHIGTAATACAGTVPTSRLAAFAVSMFLGMAAFMVTDNVVLYAAFFGVIHFLAVGLVLGRKSPGLAPESVAAVNLHGAGATS